VTEKLTMPKGRLRLRDDTESALIGLWQWETKPHTTLRALEENYLAVIDTASKVSRRRIKLKSAGKHTDLGLTEELIPAALETAKPLRRAQNAVARARKELSQRRERLKLKAPDKTNVVAALEHREIPSWLRSLPQAERDAVTGAERIDPVIAEAILSAPRELSGVAASHVKLMTDRRLEAQHPGEAEELADLERAIEVTERAVTVNADEIVKELGIPKQRFLELIEPVLKEVDAADAAEFVAPKPDAQPIDADAVFRQIEALPFNERSRFIDFAIDRNGEQLTGSSINGGGKEGRPA
jgi:hypothetical protein